MDPVSLDILCRFLMMSSLLLQYIEADAMLLVDAKSNNVLLLQLLHIDILTISLVLHDFTFSAS